MNKMAESAHRENMLSAVRAGAPPTQERVFSSGHLSADARYRIVVAGEIGPKEIEGMIQFLQLQKGLLEECHPTDIGSVT